MEKYDEEFSVSWGTKNKNTLPATIIMDKYIIASYHFDRKTGCVELVIIDNTAKPNTKEKVIHLQEHTLSARQTLMFLQN